VIVWYDFFIFFAQNIYMKRSLLAGLIVLTILGSASKVSAQKNAANGSQYTNAIGLGFDLGNGTLIGVSGKHFFTENNVGTGELLFGNHTVAIQAFYQYHKEFDGAAGLKWFVGAGPSLRFISYSGFNQTDFAIIPMAGLDYKITNVPLSISFDWRPTFYLTHSGGTEAGRFGLGFRYAMK
jgi:hypothetical protein